MSSPVIQTDGHILSQQAIRSQEEQECKATTSKSSLSKPSSVIKNMTTAASTSYAALMKWGLRRKRSRADAGTAIETQEKAAKRNRQTKGQGDLEGKISLHTPDSTKMICQAVQNGPPEMEDEVLELPHESSLLLTMIPNEVVAHLLLFVGGAEDRFALQSTCSTFRHLSNSKEILRCLSLMGEARVDAGVDAICNDDDGGDTTHKIEMKKAVDDVCPEECVIVPLRREFLQESDTALSAVRRLLPLARANNLDAIYLLGVIQSYCYQGHKYGIALLRLAAAKRGCARSAYVLGLILRDTNREESRHYMELACQKCYLPAWQEIRSSDEISSRFGEVDWKELVPFFGPPSLNRLLKRHYVHSPEVQMYHTSHCWNPHCGRWALKTCAFLGQESGGSSTADDTSPQPDHHPPFAGAACPCRGGSVSAEGAAPPMPAFRVSRMKMCSNCRRAKYCSKACQVYDWRSGRHKKECAALAERDEDEENSGGSYISGTSAIL